MSNGMMLSIIIPFLVGMAAYAEPFTPKCEVPFGKIMVKHHIDEVCGIAGESKNESNRLQNIEKNNLCAKGTPVQVGLSDFVNLETKVDEKHIAHGRDHLPSSRSILHKFMQVNGEVLGEGSVISFVGYIVDPHYSDVREGESVNCKTPGPASNDIHMSLSETPIELPRGKKKKKGLKSALLCNTVTAEVIPHLRPEAWEVKSLKRLEREGYPVRMTGQLFFDASHNACKDGKISKGNPARASLWEIHPVYNIEVCEFRSLEKCRAESKWKAVL